jgi:hypothetical protein
MGEAQRQEAEERFSELDRARVHDLPYVGKNLYLLLPPPHDAYACVGYLDDAEAKCATSLCDWHSRIHPGPR